MANTARELPQSDREIARQSTEKKASIDDMLNDHKFLEALAKQKNIEVDERSLEDSGELEKYYESFKKVEAASKGVIEVFKGDIKDDIGIDLGRAEEEAIKTYLSNGIFENPDMVNDLQERLAEYKRMGQEIKNKQLEMAKLEKKEELEKRRSNVEKRLSSVNNVKAEQLDKFDKTGKLSLKRIFTGSYGKKRFGQRVTLELEFDERSEKISVEADELNTKIKEMEDFQRVKDSFAEKFSDEKNDLFRDFGVVQELTKIARAKAHERLKQMSEKGTNLAELKKTQGDYEKLLSFKYHADVWRDYMADFEGDTGMTEDAFENKLSDSVKTKMLDEVKNVICKIKIGDKSLDQLEKGLGRIINENVASEQMETFIADALIGAKDSLSNSEEDKAKKILLQRVIIKAVGGAYRPAV